MRYLLATGNKHKLREFAAMLGNVDCSECEVEEDGGTFEANALIKVRAIASRADGAYCIADDSGLCVDALDGAPGIYSARYGRGESGPARVLRELDGIANRKAQMVTAIACIMPDGREFTVRGECEGEITAEPRGYDGFGYDPIFIPRGYSRTNAELTESEKNAISGRSVAIRMLRREVARLTARNVLIMGGTFNPPHDGHEYLLRTAIAEYDLAIVIPTGVPPHKRLPDGSPSNLERLEMTRLAFPDCEVSDIEIFRNEPSYTADTIRELGEKYPSAEFTLLMGNDMYDSLPQWYDYAWLREHVKFRMVGRDAVPTTSTRLRELLPQRQGRELLTSEVYVYVVKHRLYGVKPEFAWLWATAMKWYDESRLPHILATESLAVRLAERWGADVEETRTAALLHDITKKFDRKTHLTTLRDYGIIAETPESDNILHAVTGAEVAFREFGVSPEVRGAIRWHTTGKPGMSTLEKVIYLADKLEETRDFPDVTEMRTIALTDLDSGLLIAMRDILESVKRRGLEPDPHSAEAIAFLEGHRSSSP